MNLEQQVVSLELAQKLKELGVKQESLYVWCPFEFAKSKYECVSVEAPIYKEWEHNRIASILAYTVAELGEMLPDTIPILDEEIAYLEIYPDHSNKNGDRWWLVRYSYAGKVVAGFNVPTEADARAKMLVYLLENKLITP